MAYRDVTGNPLAEGDLVVIGLGLGQVVLGQVARMDSVLAADKNAQPLIHVMVTFPFPAAPNGVVPGLIKASKPEKVSA